MKTICKHTWQSIFIFAMFLVFTPLAHAATPTLSLSGANDGDSIQLTVRGDANSSVLFGYTKTGGEQYLSSLGKTDNNGYFSTAVSTSYYGVSAGSIVRVTINSQRSNELLWPTVAAGTRLLLSETAVSMPAGQSKTISVTGNGSNLLFLSNNSNPPVVNVNIVGNQLTFQALALGSSVVTVCANASAPICASAYVSVQSSSVQPLVFSQGNVSIAANQSLSIGVIGGSGSYVVANNSNSKVAQPTISGSNVSIKSLVNSGYSAITICSSDMTTCGVINVTAAEVTSTGLTLNQTNPVVQLGQSLSIGISGGTAGNYNVFSNSNQAAVSATVSGSSLNLVGLASGSSIITVCSGSGACGTVNATVSFADEGGSIRLGQNNLWLNGGQSQGVTISGGSMPYSVFNDATSTVKTVINNNILNLTALNSGTANISVCSSRGGCTALSVLVNTSVNTDNNNTDLALSSNNASIFVGNYRTVAIKGSGNYTIAGNSKPLVATAKISDSVLTINALAQGETVIYVCQNASQCASISVTAMMPTVNEPVTEPVVVTPPVVEPPIVTKPVVPTVVVKPTVKPAIVIRFKFKRQLQLGLQHNDVKELQKRLVSEKLYTGKISGKFDYLTKAAVQKYQKKKNIRQTGNVGNDTMAALNK